MEAAVEWCAEMLVVLTIRNDGQHWLFTSGDNLVEWWPSTSKCVINKRWKSPRQVANWSKVTPVLLKELCVPPKVIPMIREHAVPVLDNDETLDEWADRAYDWDTHQCPFEVEAR